MLTWRFAAFVAATSLLAGCARPAPLARQACLDPDARLEALLQRLDSAKTAGCLEDCGAVEREIERQTLVCPTHLPTLMASAAIAYDTKRPELAQQQLDLLLARAGRHPEAAVLRARIAVEDGNLPFAARLLRDQIALTPDHSGLHEAMGAALFLTGQRADAGRELTTAEALGAPKWRIAYHRGLIDEADGRRDDAVRHYREALDGNPGWAPAQSRLRALEVAR